MDMFICAHCGSPSMATDVDIDNGTVLTCDSCNKKTIINLIRDDMYPVKPLHMADGKEKLSVNWNDKTFIAKGCLGDRISFTLCDSLHGIITSIQLIMDKNIIVFKYCISYFNNGENKEIWCNECEFGLTEEIKEKNGFIGKEKK